jgi:hypothetical protein
MINRLFFLKALVFKTLNSNSNDSPNAKCDIGDTREQQTGTAASCSLSQAQFSGLLTFITVKKGNEILFLNFII